MSTRTKSHEGKIFQLPTGYKPDEYRIAERQRIVERKQRAIRVHRAMAAVGVAAALAGIVEVGRTLLKSPVSAKSRVEAETLANTQKKNEAVPIDNRVFVFHEGVRWRKTPDMLDPNQDTPEVSNEAGQVDKGKVLIVVRDMQAAADSNADGWEAFRLVKDLGKDENVASGSTGALAEDLMWINVHGVNGLDTQHTSEGGSFYETYIPSVGPTTPQTLVAHITSGGDIRLDFNHKSAALGQLMSKEQASKFLQGYQPDLR